jgi:hypothetical protein
VVAVPANPRDSYQFTWTGPGGRYRLTGLAAGTYQVGLDNPQCDYGDFGVPDLAPQWFSNQPDQATATRITVQPGRTTQLIAATLQPFGAIDGAVTTRAHAGVAGECVTAVPFRATVDPVSGVPPAPDIAITQSAGRYRLLDLPPGQYKIKFSSGCGDRGFRAQWWDQAASARTARVITIRNATVGGIDATPSALTAAARARAASVCLMSRLAPVPASG